MRRGVEMQGRASACVRVRFQRHDALPYAFCFNFLEATGSISFASPSPLFFFLSSLSPSPCVPLFAVTASAATARRSLVGAPRYVPRWFSALWMLLGIYSHPPLLSLPISPSLASLHPPTPSPPSPPRPVSRAFLSLPFRLSLPRDALSHAATPPQRSKGLNRPVQFPTRSASNPRSWPAIAHVVATSRLIFSSRATEGNRFFFFSPFFFRDESLPF